MQSFYNLNNNINLINMMNSIQNDGNGVCLFCAMCHNPNWVKENYPDYYNKQCGMNMNMINEMMKSHLNNMNQHINSPQNLNNDSNKNNKQEINVIFTQINGKKYSIQITLSNRVADIIQKYRIKSLDDDMTNIFILNGKKLNPDINASEAGLYNNAQIFVISNNKNLIGA